jgi:hypothetical protein
VVQFRASITRFEFVSFLENSIFRNPKNWFISFSREFLMIFFLVFEILAKISQLNKAGCGYFDISSTLRLEDICAKSKMHFLQLYSYLIGNITFSNYLLCLISRSSNGYWDQNILLFLFDFALNRITFEYSLFSWISLVNKITFEYWLFSCNFTFLPELYLNIYYSPTFHILTELHLNIYYSPAFHIFTRITSEYLLFFCISIFLTESF